MESPSPILVKLQDLSRADHFDADEAVIALRQNAPLATLHDELQAYLGSLKQKLVEVINEDYSDYVSLSSRLVNVEGAILRMRKPLLELKDKLVVVQESVKAELSSLNLGLKRRKEVAASRATLELLQELAHAASKVEKLLNEVAQAQGEGGTAAMDLDSRSRLLERVAGEVSRLSFHASRGNELDFVRNMEPRTQACRSDLESHLASAFHQALEHRDQSPQAALHILQAYTELGEAGPAESIFRKVVVTPMVGLRVAEYKSQLSKPAAPGKEGEVLSALYSSILASLQDGCGQILTASLSAHGALKIFDFLGNSILDEVQSSLAAEVPSVFSPGVPLAFHSNFLATLSFLASLESLCQGRTALDRLRSSPAYSSLMRRWNLSVYFSLVYQDVAGELEDSLIGMQHLDPHSSPLDASSPSSPALITQVHLPITKALLACVRRATSSKVFLLPLSDRFLRLLLQLLQRYATWVDGAVESRKSVTVGGATLLSTSTTGGVSGTSEGGEGPPASSSPSWVSKLPVEDLSVLHADLTVVCELIEKKAKPAMCNLLSPLDISSEGNKEGGAVTEAAHRALSSAAQTLNSKGRALIHCMAAEIAERCVAVVKQLKGITATYRMTTKGPPTRHSHYVTGALLPLKSVLESSRLASVAKCKGGQGWRASPSSSEDGQRVKELVATVAEIVCSKFQQLADELLRTVKKTEESLKRLKKAVVEGEGAMSDSEKIALQLQLDVKEFGAQLCALPGGSLDLPAFVLLSKSIT